VTQKPCFVKWCVALRDPGGKIDGCKIHDRHPTYKPPSIEPDWKDDDWWEINR